MQQIHSQSDPVLSQVQNFLSVGQDVIAEPNLDVEMVDSRKLLCYNERLS